MIRCSFFLLGDARDFLKEAQKTYVMARMPSLYSRKTNERAERAVGLKSRSQKVSGKPEATPRW
jgi:hypothetical protein